MNILYDNKLKSATATCSNTNDNFPLSNLTSRYLGLPFRTLSTTASTIQFDFSQDFDIDSFVIGYHNLNTYQIEMYDSGASLIHDSGVVTVTEGVDEVYYTLSTISNVRRIDLKLLTTVSSSYFEVGGVSSGLKLTVDCIADPRFRDTLAGNATKSTTGQITGSFASSLEEYNFGLINLNQSKKDELSTMIKLVGKYTPIWMDIYPDSNNYAIVFCNITNLGRFNKTIGQFNYSTTLTFQECK